MLGVPEPDERQGGFQVYSFFVFRRERVKGGDIAVGVVNRHFHLGVLTGGSEGKGYINRSAFVLGVGNGRNGKVGNIL